MDARPFTSALLKEHLHPVDAGGAEVDSENETWLASSAPQWERFRRNLPGKGKGGKLFREDRQLQDTGKGGKKAKAPGKVQWQQHCVSVLRKHGLAPAPGQGSFPLHRAVTWPKTLAQMLKNAKDKLRPVIARGVAKNKKTSVSAAHEEEPRRMSAEWAVDEAAAELGVEDAGATEVRLRLCGLVPHGCFVTIDLNGEASQLQSGKKFSGGNRRPAAVERRFKICSIDEDGITPSTSSTSSKVMNASASAPVSTRHHESSASFDATVLLDSADMWVKTSQALLEPKIDVMEVQDASVLIRLSQLTGDTFELTVYASGAESDDRPASTLLQRGPVRNAESVHRIDQLESSQVYVAWVRVMNEGNVKESKQKGFKTLEAKQRTVWDEKDHVILGVPETATAKEITKAWRAKSLQHHPDKESDPDKKDAAEEMMKRLNLAKQNMLKGAARDDREDKDPGDSQASPFCPASTNAASFFTGGSDSEDDDEFSACRKANAAWDLPEQGQAGQDRDDSAAPGGYKKEDARLLRCTLQVAVPEVPRIAIIERGQSYIKLQASRLPSGCRVQVQSFQESAQTWEAKLESDVTSPTMQFWLHGLEENHNYRLRLRTSLKLEPLRFWHSQFQPDDVMAEEQQEEAAAPTEGNAAASLLRAKMEEDMDAQDEEDAEEEYAEDEDYVEQDEDGECEELTEPYDQQTWGL